MDRSSITVGKCLYKNSIYFIYKSKAEKGMLEKLSIAVVPYPCFRTCQKCEKYC